MLRPDEGRFILWKIHKKQTNPVETQKANGNGSSVSHADRELAEKSRQAANSRMLTLQTSAGGPRR